MSDPAATDPAVPDRQPAERNRPRRNPSQRNPSARHGSGRHGSGRHGSGRHSLAEIEQAMSSHVGSLSVNLPAANAVSTLYRAANAVRTHLTNTVLREYGLTWTGFVVLWVVWIWDGLETRHAAESAAISKATLTGVVKTLEGQGWITRETSATDRRLVNLSLTDAGTALMTRLYPAFNAAEAEVVACLSARSLADLTQSLRAVVANLDVPGERPVTPPRGA